MASASNLFLTPGPTSLLRVVLPKIRGQCPTRLKTHMPRPQRMKPTNRPTRYLRALRSPILSPIHRTLDICPARSMISSRAGRRRRRRYALLAIPCSEIPDSRQDPQRDALIEAVARVAPILTGSSLFRLHKSRQGPRGALLWWRRR
jgi:hypothetical protein